MLFHLTSWILLLVFGAVIGSAVLGVFKSSVFCHVGDRVIAATWLGLLTIAASLLGLSAFVPLSPTVSFSLVTILTAVSLSIQSVPRDLRLWLSYLTGPVIIALGILGISSGLNSTRMVEAYDTALYHYQFVHWLSQFGTVRGFALLQERFGTSSSWFALAAPFDFGPFQRRVGGLTGGLALFLCCLHLALAASRVLYNRANRADWFLIGGYLLIIPICLTWTFEVSLSQDLPIWILTFLTGWLMLVVGDPNVGRMQQRDGLGQDSVLPLLLAAGALTVKLSAAPMVLIAGIFYWLNCSTKWVRRLVLAGSAMMISIPMFATNVISSGCPLYPNSFLCLDVPWGVGKAAAKQSAAGITEWARWGGPAPPGANTWNWIVPWFSHLDKLLLISFCCLCLVGFAAARGWRGSQPSLYVLGLAFVGTAFVSVSAPNPRFGAGYLALCPALFLASIGAKLSAIQKWRFDDRVEPSQTRAYLLVTIAILMLVQGSARERSLRHSMQAQFNAAIPADHNFLNRIVVPPALANSSGDLTFRRNRRFDTPLVLELSVERYNGIEYRRPLIGDQCWGAAIPCLPHSLTGDVHLRDPNDGFRSGFTRSAVSP
jgi:hypothetical protein